MKEIAYILLDVVPSTHDWIKSHLHQLDPKKMSCVTAEGQTAGRGRMGRKWVSPTGKNIYASLFFTTESCFLPNMGQVLALACTTVLKSYGFAPQIKWPNDILIGEKKVAGILAEAVSGGVILGIGINVNMEEEVLKTIDQPATSLACLSKKEWDRQEILQAVVHQFAHNLAQLESQGFSSFHRIFESQLAFRDQEISVRDSGHTLHGVCEGITVDGRLKLRIPSGEVLTLMTGDLELG
jgi:BirA family biotin operon repressor/biotin-[acetyl-CoA-carboxylase] ligase